MTGHDDGGVDPAQRVRPALGRREPGEHLVIAAWAGVAEEHAVELERQRQLPERQRLVLAELSGGDRSGARSEVVVG